MELPSNQSTHDILTLDVHPKLGLLDKYISSRVANKNILYASAFIRTLETTELIESKTPIYEQNLYQVAESLIKQFGINHELFNDNRCSEVFLAICDNWLINEDNPEKSNYSQERKFLEQVIRKLIGNKSQFNLDAYTRGEKLARAYVDLPDDKDHQIERTLFEGYTQHLDHEATRNVKAVLMQHGSTSFLHTVRQNLFINDPQDEAAFDVMVLNLSNSRGIWNEEKQSWDKKESSDWEDFIGGENAPLAFVVDNPVSGLPTIIIPIDIGGRLEEDARNSARSYFAESTKHEYVHTQKPMNTGLMLGTFWEELRADMAQGKLYFGGHIDVLGTYSLLKEFAMVQGIDTLPEELKKAYNDTETQADFYQFVASTFGFRSLLLSMAITPQFEHPLYGITDIPGINLNELIRLGDFLSVVIQECSARTPDFEEKLKTHLRGLPKERKKQITRLIKDGKLRVPSVIQEGLGLDAS